MTYNIHPYKWYKSELFQPKMANGKYFMTHYIFEVYQVIEREELDVENIYAMHTEQIPFKQVKQEMRA